MFRKTLIAAALAAIAALHVPAMAQTDRQHFKKAAESGRNLHT